MELTEGLSGSRAEQSLSYYRKVVFSIIVLSLIVFSIYGNSFDCSWQLDDIPNIRDNPNLHIEELSWDNVKRTLFSDRRDPSTLYRPVACLSFALNFYLGGLDLFGFHLVNILIHVFSSIFLFLFLYHTLHLPSLRAKYASKSYPIALLGTILWTINPVQTQAVTYIVQRMASLAGMFYVMSMYFYLEARTAEKKAGKFLFLISCFISFVMAFGSKENAVMLPISILLYEILLVQRDTGIFLRKNIKGIIFFLGATLLLGLTYLYYRNENIFLFMYGYENRPFSMVQRLLTEPRIIIFYISLLVYPVPNRLSIAHSIQTSTSLFDPITTLVSIVLVFGSIIYLVLLARKHPLFSFCYLFFFLNHVIESTVFPLELAFEHRNYIPSMLFFVPVAIGFYNIMELYKTKRTMKFVISVSMVLLLTGLGHSSFIRNFAWKNHKSLWLDAAEKAPRQFRVHHNLGMYYQDHGDVEQAISEYEIALESPDMHRQDERVITYSNLGKLYYDIEDYEKAKNFYQKAIYLKPDFSHALSGLACVYDKKGRRDLADYYFTRAIKANPGDPDTNFNIGLYYLKTGMPEKAIYYLKTAMKDKKLKTRSLLYLGIAYKQKGWLGTAVIHFQKLLAMDTRNITPHLHLAEIFLKTGNETMGLLEAEKIVGIFMHNEDLFYETVDLISKKGHSGDVQLSAELILPLISKACNNQSKRLNAWAAYIKKIMEK